ncbi:hypothetical protein [Streptomyces yangpuensis]|uniref:hypothetical protein n=1 Tax=Streptomyces yangpuensis TaxID=1648182 RepID=UPI003810C117
MARYAGPGVQASAIQTNKLRQVVEALKALEKKNLVRSKTGVAGQVKRGVLMECENGKSTVAASIPYTPTPTLSPPGIRICRVRPAPRSG